MSPEERQLLAGLFERTKAAAAGPRDREAEAFINDQIKSQPAAAYLLAQTVIVQDQALQAANQRLEQLEARVRELESAPRSGSFLGGLFGGGAGVGATQAPPPRPAPGPGGPWGAPQQQGNFAPPPNYAAQSYAPQAPMAPQQGGGFLKGALGAAAGVAGGVLLADGIRNLFHGPGMGAGMGGLGIGSGYEPGGVHETVINNYYGDQGSSGQDYQDAGYDDRYDDSSVQDADYGSDDGGFDGGGDGGFDV